MSEILKQCPKCGYRGRPCELGCGGKDCPMLVARREREGWKCICAGQGGEIYISGCPIHDSHVDHSDEQWRALYKAHLRVQARTRERLGW